MSRLLLSLINLMIKGGCGWPRKDDYHPAQELLWNNKNKSQLKLKQIHRFYDNNTTQSVVM